MISWNTNVDLNINYNKINKMIYWIWRFKSVSFFSSWIFNVFCNLSSSSNSHNCYLWPQNGWNKVGTTKISNTWYAECSVWEIFRSQFSLFCLISNLLYFIINLNNASFLNLLNVRYCKSILWVNSNRKIMIFFYNVFSDISILVCFRVEMRVNNREFSHCNRCCLDEKW